MRPRVSPTRSPDGSGSVAGGEYPLKCRWPSFPGTSLLHLLRRSALCATRLFPCAVPTAPAVAAFPSSCLARHAPPCVQQFSLLVSTAVTCWELRTGRGDLPAFHLFDEDGDGKISQQELANGFAHIGEKLSDEQQDAIVRACDCDGDMHIDYKEFQMMAKLAGEVAELRERAATMA